MVSYPTEGVFGLGCLPTDEDAILRLLELKRRDAAKGLILLTDTASKLAGWIDVNPTQIPDPDPSLAVTWIVPAGPLSSDLVTGGRDTVAVRVTTHPLARAVCQGLDAPIISTSANRSGGRAIRRSLALRKQFFGRLAHFVPGQLGNATGSSEIRDLISGAVLRPAGKT